MSPNYRWWMDRTWSFRRIWYSVYGQGWQIQSWQSTVLIHSGGFGTESSDRVNRFRPDIVQYWSIQEDLVLSLRTGLTDPGLTEYSIPLFMEKLDSDLESAKVRCCCCLLCSHCSNWTMVIKKFWSMVIGYVR